jgi:hypothetical protein
MPVIGWGLGHNTHFGAQGVSVEESRFSLLGLRDWGIAKEWVPCVSCMSEEITRARATKPRHDVVVYSHFKKPLAFDGVPSLSNGCMNLGTVMDFLASGDVVITNSYHGAYWAQLLGRRVVVIPFSNRFLHFRYPTVLATPEDCLAKVRDAQAYPEAFEVCRTRTMEFAGRVSEILGTELTPVSRQISSP